MAGSSDSEHEDRWRRNRRRSPADPHDDEPEEGEVVPSPGCDSGVDTGEYYSLHSSSCDTDETISDGNARSVPASNYGGGASPSSASANSNSNASSSSVVAATAVPACHICGKQFRSRKAVCGHMKVHPHGIGRHDEQRIGKDKGNESNVVVAGGWGGTGKRGCSGTSWRRASSPNAQSDQSMAIGVAEPKVVLQPMPLAFAAPNPLPVPMASATPDPSSLPVASGTPNPSSSITIASTTTNASSKSSSAKPIHNDAMETVVAGAANPPTEAVVHIHDAHAPPSPSPHATSVHQQPIDPPPPPPPAAEERAPPPPVHHAGRQNPEGYKCKQCGRWYPTFHALGGHTASHGTRKNADAPFSRDAKPEKTHVCKFCGAVFTAGVQLGGHMRKHYTGAPIVPKKKPRLAIQPLPPPAEAVADPTLTLLAKADEASRAPAGEAAAQQPAPAPAVQGTFEPAPRSAVAGRVLLFGVDIGAGVRTPSAQE